MLYAGRMEELRYHTTRPYHPKIDIITDREVRRAAEALDRMIIEDFQRAIEEARPMVVTVHLDDSGHPHESRLAFDAPSRRHQGDMVGNALMVSWDFGRCDG